MAGQLLLNMAAAQRRRNRGRETSPRVGRGRCPQGRPGRAPRGGGPAQYGWTRRAPETRTRRPEFGPRVDCARQASRCSSKRAVGWEGLPRFFRPGRPRIRITKRFSGPPPVHGKHPQIALPRQLRSLVAALHLVGSGRCSVTSSVAVRSLARSAGADRRCAWPAIDRGSVGSVAGSGHCLRSANKMSGSLPVRRVPQSRRQ